MKELQEKLSRRDYNGLEFGHVKIDAEDGVLRLMDDRWKEGWKTEENELLCIEKKPKRQPASGPHHGSGREYTVKLFPFPLNSYIKVTELE